MAAFEVFSGIQPFEENQSPPPVESNPYESSLARGASRRSQPSSPTSIGTTNTLSRQLSPDPESPPPAWKRRPSVTSQFSSTRSISQSSLAPPSRRHPGLAMTAALPRMFLHESPNGSSSDLVLPQPAFRRKSQHSNRSSMHDVNGLSSEELWRLGQEDRTPDLANPDRDSGERPLDTMRRMSRRVDQPGWQTGLPTEVIWPAPPPGDIAPPPKSKSLTHIPSLAKRKKTLRSASVRQPSLDAMKSTKPTAKSVPASPEVNRLPEPIFLSSAHSSSTSLTSHAVTPKSNAINSRPPSAYYSRDFLSSLAPREGGYAIAAQMGNGLGAAGTMSVEEKRRSITDDRSFVRPSRAPMSKSAGMGRWSLDGEQVGGYLRALADPQGFNRKPYTTPSAATTSSNLSTAPPITTSPDLSPSLEDTAVLPSVLPEGASPSASVLIGQSTPAHQRESSPTPSPLSQHVEAPIEPATPTLSSKRSKKLLSKEAKAAEKADAIKLAKEKAEKLKLDVIEKHRAKEEAKRKEREDKEGREREKEEAKRKDKEDRERERENREKEKEELKRKEREDKEKAKIKEREDKERRKAEKAEREKSIPSLLAFKKSHSTSTSNLASVSPVPTTKASPASGSLPKASASTRTFPLFSSQSAYKAPPPDLAPSARSSRSSMPLNASLPMVSEKPKGGFFGSIKKRFSLMGDEPKLRSISSKPSDPIIAEEVAQPVVDEQPVIIVDKSEAPIDSVQTNTPLVTPRRSSGASSLDKPLPPVDPGLGEAATPTTMLSTQMDPESIPLPRSIRSVSTAGSSPMLGGPDVAHGQTGVPDVSSSSSPYAALSKSVSHEPAASLYSNAPLSKTTSHDPSPIPVSPPSSTRSRAVSLSRPGKTVEGPRPMPRSSPRPTSSISSHQSHNLPIASPSMTQTTQYSSNESTTDQSTSFISVDEPDRKESTETIHPIATLSLTPRTTIIDSL
ncbi:hypothetical protein P7C73_g5935, partial [Tremellales sp. Uapishka_1]